MRCQALSVALEYSIALIIRLAELLYKGLTEEHSMPCPNCGKPILTEKYCSSCGTANPIDYIDESVKVSKTRVARGQVKSQVPIRVILVGAGVALAVLMAALFANNYALSNMQYRLASVSAFDYTSLTSQVKLEACNPTAIPAGFDRFSAIVDYRQSEFARITVVGGSVMPYQSSTFDGDLKLSAQTVSGLIIALADAVGGTDSQYNENDISLKMTLDAKILGIMPYSQTKEFTFAEFQQFMSTQQADQYLCG
jgi:hypothetical protein